MSKTFSKKIKQAFLSGLLLVALPFATLAEGLYAGFGFGWAWNDIESSDFPGSDIDDNSRGFRAIGGYEFAQMGDYIIPLAEIRYSDLGKVDIGDGNIEQQAVTLNAILSMPYDSVWGGPQAKVGLSFMFRDQSGDIHGKDFDGDTVGLVLGVGWARRVAFLSDLVPGDIFTRIEYEHFFDPDYDIDFVSIGLGYRF